MPIPPLDSEDKRQDFSHVVEFCSRLESLNIVGSNIPLGNSTIIPNQYPIDLSIFKTLKTLTLKLVNIEQMKEVGSARHTVEKLDIFNCDFLTLNQLFLCDSLYKSWKESGPNFVWPNITTVYCSNNTFEV